MDQKQQSTKEHSSHKLFQKAYGDNFSNKEDYKQIFTEQHKKLNAANNKQLINLNNPIHHNSGRITLVVENTRFIVNTELFVGHLDTMLGRMFGSTNYTTSNLIRPNEKGEYNVAEGISANVFKTILVSF